jgi:23S rRNA (guanine2445-N2)-methyltransferase / 23S rRNA (guanine2069-N7)-methyltransferase
MTHYPLFATTPKAIEMILADELKSLGAEAIKPTLAGVAFTGTLETAYRVCLWSRTANRILLALSEFEVKSQAQLYQQVQKIDWSQHLNATDSFAVSFSAKNSKAIDNSHFGALKVKDAIVDQMRDKFGERPNINTDRPDIRINVYLNGETAQLSLDLAGESLHKRGFREVSIEAPIKENLAAAILLRGGWGKIAASGGSLIDPMCGSGTLVLEAAMIASDCAPGLLREYYGFLGWKQHDSEIWQALLDEAQQRKTVGLKTMPVIVGFDLSRQNINVALQHVENAGFADKIHLERRDIADAAPAASWAKGLVVCNPPYGERLGEEAETALLYQRFGESLKAHFQGWKAVMIISNPELGFRLGIRSQKPITLFNGALECKLLRLDIEESEFFIPKAQNQEQRLAQINLVSQTEATDSAGEMFANRLRKNLKNLSKWAKQQNISCYRLYDADLPEYAVAIDVYQGEKLWVNVQEYDPPKSIEPHKAIARLGAVLAEIPKVLAISKEQVFLKIRKKQKSTDQYQKHNELGNFHIVSEGGCQFWVNFEDYLDTGLFLDHRPMRLLIGQQAKGKRFLNLFAYTGTATIHAAMGGAKSTTTVDMSKTYLDWAKRNLDLNKISGDHQLIQANCVDWLAEEARQSLPRQFDLIFLDPPTFSNSKRMEEVFDVQVDHVALINNAVELLAPGGVLYFSTNFRKFKLDKQALADWVIEDISAKTIPHDFARDAKIHYCWKISQ